LPTAEVVRAVVKNRLANVRLGRIDWDQVISTAAGLSHSEITSAAERAAKDAILARRPLVESSDLVRALRDRQARTSD
jgi:ATP-dependent 26S proteasome regulatory subunit